MLKPSNDIWQSDALIVDDRFQVDIFRCDGALRISFYRLRGWGAIFGEFRP